VILSFSGCVSEKEGTTLRRFLFETAEQVYGIYDIMNLLKSEEKESIRKMLFPPYVMKTLKILNTAGFEAYVVGGAVRDLLLGTEPCDYDITTNARPAEIVSVLGSAGYTLTEKLGENYGVVAAVTEGCGLEIATFRNERYAYGRDAHRPAEVWFCDTLEEDLSRRDFTVNAMAMDYAGKLYDYHGGQQDLKEKQLRTVGDPRRRFAEDALRMYRACRFVAQLDFTYVEGKDTAEDVSGGYDYHESVAQNLRAALEKAGKTVPPDMKTMGPGAQLTGCPGESGFGQPGTKYRLKKRYVFDITRCRELSLERVKTELDKMLVGKAAGKGLALYLSTGLASAQCRVREKGTEQFVDVLPELAHLPALPQNIRFHCYNVWEHILAAVDNGPRDLTVRWALLLHDVAKGLPGIRGTTPDGYPNDHGHEKESAAMARTILTRLRCPQAAVRRIEWLVSRHMRFAPMLIRKNNTLLRWIRSEAVSGIFRTEAEMTEAFSQLVEIFLADMGATWAGVLKEGVMEEGRGLGREAVRIACTEMPVHTSDLAVNGREIQEVLTRVTEKEEDSPAVGDLMKYLLARVQSGNIANNKETLLAAVETRLERKNRVPGSG